MQTAKRPTASASTHAHVPEPLGGVRPARISHVVLKSHDVDRMIEWYCIVLNAQVVLRHRIISFITWDGAHDRLGTRIQHDADGIAGQRTLGEDVDDPVAQLDGHGRRTYRRCAATVAAMPTSEVLSMERDGPVATLWLDSAERRNAMGPDFWADLPVMMGELADDEFDRAAGGSLTTKQPAFVKAKHLGDSPMPDYLVLTPDGKPANGRLAARSPASFQTYPRSSRQGRLDREPKSKLCRDTILGIKPAACGPVVA